MKILRRDLFQALKNNRLHAKNLFFGIYFRNLIKEKDFLVEMESQAHLQKSVGADVAQDIVFFEISNEDSIWPFDFVKMNPDGFFFAVPDPAFFISLCFS